MKEQIEITKEAIKHFENLYSEEIETICSDEYFIYISLKNQLAIMEHLSKENNQQPYIPNTNIREGMGYWIVRGSDGVERSIPK